MHIQQAVIQAQQKIHFSLKGNVHNNIIYPLPLVFCPFLISTLTSGTLVDYYYQSVLIYAL